MAVNNTEKENGRDKQTEGGRGRERGWRGAPPPRCPRGGPDSRASQEHHHAVEHPGFMCHAGANERASRVAACL